MRLTHTGLVMFGALLAEGTDIAIIGLTSIDSRLATMFLRTSAIWGHKVEIMIGLSAVLLVR